MGSDASGGQAWPSEGTFVLGVVGGGGGGGGEGDAHGGGPVGGTFLTAARSDSGRSRHGVVRGRHGHASWLYAPRDHRDRPRLLLSTTTTTSTGSKCGRKPAVHTHPQDNPACIVTAIATPGLHPAPLNDAGNRAQSSPLAQRALGHTSWTPFG